MALLSDAAQQYVLF
uniref:Uncharacterized protein n=1 Tax=Musa acuminata subsp. malaccensis TaxID=214687 RepID=A0A804IXP9_MUSAM